MKKSLLIIPLIGIFFFFKPPSETVSIKLGEENLVVRLAETQVQREKGLSGVKEMRGFDGMLFLFPEEGIYSIWMKDMLLSLDIVWINDQKEVIEIKTNISPNTYPELFSPEDKVKYILEVPGGWAEKKGLKTGDKLVFYE